MMKPPIAVMSFNRPAYLRQVLDSLAAQPGIGGHEVFLFQDNWRNPHSGRICADAGDIAACIAAFREVFHHGHILAAPDNLGVAANFHRAETLFFRELRAECGYFFEDDLVLAPRYLATLDAVREEVEPGGSVGYFACYGHLQAPEEEQQRRARELRRLGHLWGFGLFRRHWEAMQPAMADYHALVLGRDYRDRPHAEILRRYRDRGILVGVSSQDDVKKAVTYAIGRVALNTTLVSARYIGEHGLHSNPKSFERGGYAATVMAEVDATGFDMPDIAALAAEEQEARRRSIERAAGVTPAPRETRLRPSPMAPEERALLEQVLASGARRYAEFGIGASTLLAVRAPFETIVCVESDPAWIAAARAEPDIEAAVASGRASLLHADIGPVGNWGAPVGRAAQERWPGYVARMWAEWDRRGATPDLVFADGRFRVACCLSAALLAALRGREPPLVLLHGISDRRPGYARVLDFFDTQAQAGTLHLLRPRRDASPEALLAGLLDRLFDPT